MCGKRGWAIFKWNDPYAYITRAIVGGLCGAVGFLLKKIPVIGKKLANVTTYLLDAFLVPLMDQWIAILFRQRANFDVYYYVKKVSLRLVTAAHKVGLPSYVTGTLKEIAYKVGGGIGCTFGRAFIKYLSGGRY